MHLRIRLQNCALSVASALDRGATTHRHRYAWLCGCDTLPRGSV
jgi:hypothetical protein